MGKKCGRCSTRYCGAACQVQHWKEGGHAKLCKLIKKAGGAEQYNANQKSTAAVAVAAEACAEDTKGQTCYICTQALHWKTKEGLVRMCACRGTAGFAHVSCLAEEAKILVAEAEENKLGLKVLNERFARWSDCSLCEQEYHGAVRCALGWACWKTYLGRPEKDPLRWVAMSTLGNDLSDANHHDDALSVQLAELAMLRRIGVSESNMLNVQSNLARSYDCLGRDEPSLHLRRGVYYGHLRLQGEEHRSTLEAASNYAFSLLNLKRFEEAKSLMRKTMPIARRVLGESHHLTLRIRWHYAAALYEDTGATLDDVREAVTTLTETVRIARRVLGGADPDAMNAERELRYAQLRAELRSREETQPSPGSG